MLGGRSVFLPVELHQKLCCCDQPVCSVGADWKIKQRQRPLDTRFFSCLPVHSSSISALTHQDAAPTICYWSSPSCHALVSCQIWCLCISSHTSPSSHTIPSYQCPLYSVAWCSELRLQLVLLLPCASDMTQPFCTQESDLHLLSTFCICFCHNWLVATKKKKMHILVFLWVCASQAHEFGFLWWICSIRILLVHYSITFSCSWDGDS